MSSRAIQNVERFIYLVFPIALLIGSGDSYADASTETIRAQASKTFLPRDTQRIPQTTTLYFDTDHWQLDPDTKQALQQHVNYLKVHRHKILVIHGHADEHGTEAYNMALSEQRANYIKQFFIKQGISSPQLQIHAHGEHQAFNTSQELNRRVELQYDTAMYLSAWQVFTTNY